MSAIIYARLYTENYYVDGEFIVDNEKLSFTDYENTINISLNSIFAITITESKLYCKLVHSISVLSISCDYIILDIENIDDFYSKVLSNMKDIPIINTVSNIYVREDGDFNVLLRRKPIRLYPLYYRHKGAYLTCRLEAHHNGFILAHKPPSYSSHQKIFKRILYKDINFVQLIGNILQLGDISTNIYVQKDFGTEYVERVERDIKTALVELIKAGIPVPILF